MKKVKNYIESELAKKKIARYKYWSIKDENGITIVASEDDQEGKCFEDFLDKIIADNVDAEVQVKYGTNEQSSRQNPPLFIRINESIEWIEPEEDETVQINGVAHKVDKNGNVNINLTTPQQERTTPEAVPIDHFREEFELQLQGIRKEHELKEERYKTELHNKLSEQTLKFKEMMLQDRESRISEREEALSIKEAELEEKEKEMREDVKGYVRHIPSALGGVIKDWIKEGGKKESGLGKAKKEKKSPKRRKVNFEIEEEENEEAEENRQLDLYDAIKEEEYQPEEEEDQEQEQTELKEKNNNKKKNHENL